MKLVSHVSSSVCHCSENNLNITVLWRSAISLRDVIVSAWITNWKSDSLLTFNQIMIQTDQDQSWFWRFYSAPTVKSHLFLVVAYSSLWYMENRSTYKQSAFWLNESNIAEVARVSCVRMLVVKPVQTCFTLKSNVLLHVQNVDMCFTMYS